MIARLLRTAAAAAACFLAVPAPAKDPAPSAFRQLKAGDSLEVRPDRAYLLLRFDTSVGKFPAVLLRVPTDGEVAAYEADRAAAYAKKGSRQGPIETFAFDYNGRPNLFTLSAGKGIAADGKTVVAVAEVTPGDYVFYGTGHDKFLFQCLCLGTVGFAAPAGEVTDLGTMIVGYASKPSNRPELAGETDLGPSASMDYQLFAVALRPHQAGETMPAGLSASKVGPASFHAVGPFLEAGTYLINRLAPIPGILRYEEGRVIDVATGSEALPQ